MLAGEVDVLLTVLTTIIKKDKKGYETYVDKLSEEGNELDYLQVFKIRKCEEGIVIEHSQEVPEYKEKYVIDLENIEVNGNIKVFVIDDYEYSTMMLAEEY